MRSELLLAICCATLSCAAVVRGAELGANVLRNPGFENGDTGPTDWSFAWKHTHSTDRERGTEKQEPDWAWEDKTVHSGKRSIRVGVKRPDDDGVWSQENVPHVKGTKIYLVRAWLKAENLKGTTAQIGCVSLGKNGKWLGANYSILATDGTHDWKLCTGYLEAHPKAEKFRVRLWVNMGYSGTGTAWFDDVEIIPTDMTELPPIRYVDKSPMPPLSDADQQSGCVLFEKSYLEMVFPNTIPKQSEICDTLRLFATPGEQEPVTLCVRSLKDLGTVKGKATDLKSENGTIGSNSIRVNPVQCRIQHGQSRWGAYAEGDMLVPVIVQETDTTTIPAETTKQFWVTVKVPPDAKPGTYRGRVEIQPEKGGARSMGLELEVLPFRLTEPKHIYFGMYCRFRGGPDLDFTNTAYKDMREHGMTTIGLCCNFGGAMEMDGDTVKVTLDGTSDLEQAIAAYQRAGFRMPILWLMGRDIMRFALKQGALDSDAFEKCYRQVIEAIVAEGKKQGWPEIIFQPLDEPYEHGKRNIVRKDPNSPTILEATKRCLQIMKKIPGLRTEEDGANGAPHNLEELYPWVDVETYHDGPVLKRGTYDAKAWEEFLARLRREGKEIWFYNIDITGFHPEPLRFGYGFGLYAARATGMIEWAYMTGYKSDQPDRLYKSKLPLAYRYNKTETEIGGPTTAWEAAREGVDDYKYLHTLLSLTGKLRAQGKADLAEKAEKDVLDRIAKIDFHGCTGKACQGEWTGEKGRLPTGEKFVSGGYKMANGLSFADYNSIRCAIADWIVKLHDKE